MHIKTQTILNRRRRLIQKILINPARCELNTRTLVQLASRWKCRQFWQNMQNIGRRWCQYIQLTIFMLSFSTFEKQALTLHNTQAKHKTTGAEQVANSRGLIPRLDASESSHLTRPMSSTFEHVDNCTCNQSASPATGRKLWAFACCLTALI